mmetsp:Transcript_16919/g.33769  ORF Transcript_16919/g.33769 Transcript_16919/m.33769 type:complete len:219 (-) Transcript_16919:167-823(-)
MLLVEGFGRIDHFRFFLFCCSIGLYHGLIGCCCCCIGWLLFATSNISGILHFNVLYGSSGLGIIIRNRFRSRCRRRRRRSTCRCTKLGQPRRPGIFRRSGGSRAAQTVADSQVLLLAAGLVDHASDPIKVHPLYASLLRTVHEQHVRREGPDIVGMDGIAKIMLVGYPHRDCAAGGLVLGGQSFELRFGRLARAAPRCAEAYQGIGVGRFETLEGLGR